MTEVTGPRPDVLAERISGLSGRFDSIERRIDNLATKDELVSLIANQNTLTNSQLADLREDVKNLTGALAAERAERQQGDKDNEERANRSKAYALSAIGLVISVVLGLIALINQIGGAP